MKYRVEISEKASKQLRKMDQQTARLLLAWIKKNLQGCENPRLQGKGLTGNLSGKWRYRVGNYRILAEIKDQELLILVVETGHRGEIYQ